MARNRPAVGRLRLHRRWPGLPLLFALAFATASFCQQPEKAPEDPAADTPQHTGIFRFIPKYQIYDLHKPYKPITAGEKFKIATRISTKPGSILLGAVLAGRSQWANSNPEFGQGVKGYAHYFGTGYADTVIGNYLSEAVFPSLLRQDPRYFRSGSGSKWRRISYAVSRVLVARADSGRWQFNYSEVGGNATGVAISTAYYPNDRSVSEVVAKLGIRLAFDGAANVLKEFWPDIDRKLFARKAKAEASGH